MRSVCSTRSLVVVGCACQDAHICTVGLPVHAANSLFAVFDGHGGDATAKAAYVPPCASRSATPRVCQLCHRPSDGVDLVALPASACLFVPLGRPRNLPDVQWCIIVSLCVGSATKFLPMLSKERSYAEAKVRTDSGCTSPLLRTPAVAQAASRVDARALRRPV